MRNGAISSAITKVRSQERHLALRAATSIIKSNLRSQELQGDTWYDTRDCDELLTPADLYAATGYLVRLNEPEAGEVVTENVPMRMSETPGKVRGLAPLMGEHTHEIARNLLGLSDDEIRKLDEEKVLY